MTELCEATMTDMSRSSLECTEDFQGISPNPRKSSSRAHRSYDILEPFNRIMRALELVHEQETNQRKKQ